MKSLWWLALALAPALAAGGLEQPFEFLVAPATSESMRHSEPDFLDLRDGRILLTWIDFYSSKDSDWGPARISGLYSRDKGRTWYGKFTLQENIGRMNVMEPDLLRLKSGKVLFLFCRKNSEADCRPMVRLSTDDARTFSPPAEMAITPSPSYTGFNHDRAIQLRSGRVLMPVFFTTDYRVDPHIRSRVYYSDDEGATWTPGSTILDIAGSKQGPQEPGVVELKDGRILLWARTDKGQIYRSYSTDQGVTFSPLEPMGIDSPLSPQSIKRIPSTGDLLLVWNYSTTERRYPLTSAISSDEGRTWKHFRNLDQDSFHTFAYTGIQFLKDRTLLAYYSGPTRGIKSDSRWSLKLKALPNGWLYDRKTVVALGDSVTWGIRTDGSVKPADTFVSVLEKELAARRPGAHVVNAGIGGNNTRQMLERLDHDVLRYEPRLVILMAGLNDAAHIAPGGKPTEQPRIAVEEYERNLTEIIRRVRAAGGSVLLATPNPMTPKYHYASIGWYKGKEINTCLLPYLAAVKRVAAATHVPMVDVFSKYKHWKGFEDTLPDGIHPDARGHRFLAGLFLPGGSKAVGK
jgi:lysophospholipase L1-like esterase